MSDTNSGSIEINITRERETARAVTLQLIGVGKRHGGVSSVSIVPVLPGLR